MPISAKRLAEFERTIVSVSKALVRDGKSARLTADELANDVRILVWKYGNTFDPAKGRSDNPQLSMRNWVKRIAIRVAYNHSQRRTHESLNERAATGEKSSPVVHAEYDEIKRAHPLFLLLLNNRLQRIPPQDQELLLRLENESMTEVYRNLFGKQKHDKMTASRFFAKMHKTMFKEELKATRAQRRRRKRA